MTHISFCIGAGFRPVRTIIGYIHVADNSAQSAMGVSRYLFRVDGKVLSIQLQYSQECLLRNFDVANLLHSFLPSFLFFQQLALTTNVTTVTFGGHILSDTFDGFAGDNLGSDGSLNGNVELLARNELFELLAHPSAEGHGVVLMGER